MAIKPILFNTDMVKAILEGRKTQTRRIIKTADGVPLSEHSDTAAKRFISMSNAVHKAPYEIGDILWVRETWCPCASIDSYLDDKKLFAYRADYGEYCNVSWKWRPSIHMPKEAARIFLIVKRVRTERLQDISFEDCKAEGIWDDYNTPSHIYHENLQRAAYPVVFKELWNSTIKKSDLPKYGWDANPWVRVIEFERCEKPEGFPCYVQEAKLR